MVNQKEPSGSQGSNSTPGFKPGVVKVERNGFCKRNHLAQPDGVRVAGDLGSER